MKLAAFVERLSRGNSEGEARMFDVAITPMRQPSSTQMIRSHTREFTSMVSVAKSLGDILACRKQREHCLCAIILVQER